MYCIFNYFVNDVLYILYISKIYTKFMCVHIYVHILERWLLNTYQHTTIHTYYFFLRGSCKYIAPLPNISECISLKKMTYILIYKFISHQTQEININIILLYNYWSYWKFASSPNNVLSCPGSSAGSLIALNFHVSLSPLIWNNFSFRKIFYCSDNFEFYRPVIL